MTRIFDFPIKTNDTSLDRVLSAGLPVMLIFQDEQFSTSLQASLDHISSQAAGKILVAQISRKDNPNSFNRFQINSVPFVVLFMDGTDVFRGPIQGNNDISNAARYLLGEGPKPTKEYGTDHPQISSPINVTDTTFAQEVIQSDIPVIVDFWAAWCGPCRMVAPILDRLAPEYKGRIKIAKVNVDENPQLAARYQIQSIPTMLIIQKGQIIDRWSGALPESALRGKINRF